MAICRDTLLLDPSSLPSNNSLTDPATENMQKPHFLFITFPAQGHINPALELGKRLVKLGSRVTFVTSTFAYRKLTEVSRSDHDLAVENVTFATYSDGYDDGKPESVPPHLYMKEIRRHSSLALPKLIESSVDEGRPVSLLIYSLLLPWAAEVAREFDVPSALLWIQPAALLAVYYHYFNENYTYMFDEVVKGQSSCVRLSGLPPLTKFDFPSHLVTTKFALPGFQEHLEELRKETNPKVLINTFDALEPEALEAVKDFVQAIAIGPLIPSGYLNGIEDDKDDSSFSCDLFANNSRDKYMNFLDSNKNGSVVYISFGSTSVLPKIQMEEIIDGLISSPFFFLWVVREVENGDIFNQFAGKRDELEKRGLVVQWCSQIEVLSHPSVGCFLTHCGWNSTAESMACGVPVVAFPQWADQPTNAKLAEDLWRIGVRMKPNKEGVVEAEEVRKSLEKVMTGEGTESMAENVKKWKEAAKTAVKSGGSSDINLKNFLQEIKGGA